jgi:hypothetical protein
MQVVLAGTANQTRGIGAMSKQGKRRSDWRIGESDFGGPMVEHRHSDGDSVAYVLVGRNGGEVAQCAGCGRRVSLAGRSTTAE